MRKLLEKGSYWGSKAAAAAGDKDEDNDDDNDDDDDDDDVDDEAAAEEEDEDEDEEDGYDGVDETDDDDDSAEASIRVMEPLRANLSRFLLSTSNFSTSSSNTWPFKTDFFAETALLLCSSSVGALLAMAFERILSDNVHRGQQNNTNTTTTRLRNVIVFRWVILFSLPCFTSLEYSILIGESFDEAVFVWMDLQR